MTRGLAILIALLGAASAAQTPDDASVRTRPAAANRVVASFDFEEADETLEPVPQHWVRSIHLPESGINRPGFPRWNESGFDDSTSVSGEFSVRLPTRGGSAALRLASGVVPVIPGADYAVSTHLRTSGLEHARARLVARFLDDHNQPVEGAEVASDLLRSETGWRRVETRLPGQYEEAAWIQIELQLLQPNQYEQSDPPEHEARLQDVDGAAWFDDVEIRQTPRIDLVTNHPTNVIIAPRRPTLTTSIRDLTGETLRANVTLRDIDGRIVDDRTIAVPKGARTIPWTPELEAFGWYSAELSVRGETGQSVGRRRIDFVWAPARGRDPGADKERFGVSAIDLPEQHRSLLPDLIEQLGTGAVTIPAWDADVTPQRVDEHTSEIAPMIERLLSAGQAVTMAFAPAPSALIQLARRAGLSENRLLAEDPESVGPFMEHIVARFGQRVRRWRLTADVENPPVDAELMADAARSLGEMLSRLAPEPRPVAPWPASQALDAALLSEADLTLEVPASFQTPTLAHLAQVMPESAGSTLLMELPDPERFGQRSTAIELARRLVRVWQLEPRAVSIGSPWSSVDSSGRAAPSPVFAAYRNCIERLAMRRIVGALPVGDGAAAFILEGPGADAIVAWRYDPGDVSTGAIETYLSEGPVEVVDIFGNARSVEAVDGAHRIDLGESPVFIEGVDVDLARFRAGFAVEPKFIPSSASRHRMRLSVVNPWPRVISGRLRIAEPEHWNIAPRVMRFNIPPGERSTYDFEASFGVAEEAGPARFEVEFDVAADEHYPLIRLTDQVEIGLPTVQLAPSYRLERNEEGELTDLSVTLLVTNISDRPQTLQSFATAPGFPRQSAPISDLPPNQSTVKRFRFRGGAEALRGRDVRVGLIETQGFGRLNRTITID